MSFDTILSSGATLLSAALGLTVLYRRQSVAGWSFGVGMTILAVDSVLSCLASNAPAEKAAGWLAAALMAKAFLPGVWLCFSKTYARGDYRQDPARGRLILAGAILLPFLFALGFHQHLVRSVRMEEGGFWLLQLGTPARILNATILGGFVLVLMNLERTFRSSVGTMRWRIKLMVLGLGVIFGARIYTRSQFLLFSSFNPAWNQIETASLFIGCVLIAIGYLRSGFSEIEVYPSQAVLRNSLTLLIVGGYLLAVGILAELVRALGGIGGFQLQVLLVLLSVAFLGLLVFSDRFRLDTQRFVSRHFKRPQHDSRNVWTLMTRKFARVLDEAALCGAATSLISETFHVLSVTICKLDEAGGRLVAEGPASPAAATSELSMASDLSREVLDALQARSEPFDLEKIRENWADVLKAINPRQFEHGGNRICIPLHASDRCLGAIVLADRVEGMSYSVEELDLLKCIGDQVAANLLNLRLSGELMQAKQLEAFQAMSTFFVHDLKNTASSLNLMLRNLPVHFENPEFRKDALRSIGATADHINQLIGRLSLLRERIEVKPVPSDLNRIVSEVLETEAASPEIELVRELNPLPLVSGDVEQLRSVVVNLLVNAREAVNGNGRIRVTTSERDGQAVLSVEDNGCGMSPEFVRGSLFRPFQTTKKKGIGIGMFHTRRIVEAHRGRIQVESEPGKGTTFRVSLPGKAERLTH